MKNKAKLILASAVFVAALMLLVPLAQTDMSGGGGIGNSDSDPIVLSENTSVGVSTFSDLISKIGEASVNAVKLTNNIEATQKIELSKSLTLDLNGQTLTLTGLNRIEVGAGGDLKITDSSTTSAGKIVYIVASDENSAIKVAGTGTSNLAKLTLEKCEIVVNENNNVNGYGIYAASYSEVTSGDGVTITAGYSAISGNGLNSGAKITITGGSYTSNNSAAIYFPSTNKLTVTGGTFTGATGFDIRAGTVTISDAEINATGSYTNVADDSDSTRTDIPTVWGMGIAIIDHVSYSKDAEISITLSNLTFSSTTSVCDLYIGDFNQKTGVDAGKFNENNLDQTFTVNKNITVTVTDVLNYSVTKSANETSGYLIVNDLDTSSKTFTVTNLFNKGNATVENKGTIVVNDLDSLRSAAAIGGNIQLVADIEIRNLTTFLTLADKTVLDLNDKTITMNTTCVESNGKSSSINRLLVNNGNVTIKNGSIVDNATSTDRSPIIVSADSGSGGSGIPKLIIDDVTITSENEYGIVVFTGELEVKNNSLITAKLSAISGNGTMAGSNITLNGGTYTSTTTAAIFFPSTTKLTIENSAEIIGKTGIDIRAGTLDIKNSSITASGNTSEEFPASNGPSGWGMGIAVFDHKAYGDSISVTIENVTFNTTFCDVYVGTHPTVDGAFIANADATINDNIIFIVKNAGNDILNYTLSNNDKTKLVGSFAINVDSDEITILDDSVVGSACIDEITSSATLLVSNATGLEAAVKFGGDIKLIENITLTKAVTISENVIIDLNDKKITSPNNDFALMIAADSTIKNGSIEGSKGLKYNLGTSSLDDVLINVNMRGVGIYDGAKLTVDEYTSITSNAECGITIIGDSSQLDLYGEVIAKSEYGAIQGNGNTASGGTIIKIYGGAKVESESGSAIYHPQSGAVTISGGEITGAVALGIKSGTFEITGGTFTSNGTYDPNIGPWSNGINLDGSVILIDSNSDYAGKVSITISGSTTFTSTNGHAIREITTKGDNSQLTAINISEGKFTSASGIDVILVSDSVKDKVSIIGGTFSTNPQDYVNDTLTIESNDNVYTVYLYKIIFNSNGGSSVNPAYVSEANQTITKPADPTRSNYSFVAWYKDEELVTEWNFATDTITENTTLYAKWTYTGGSGIPVTPPTDDPEPEPIIPDENNNVTVPPIDDKKADELVHEAVSSGSDSISIIDTNNVEGEYTEVTVSKSDLETISKKIENNNNINSVSIETSEGDIIIEKEVLNSILETNDSDSISFEIEDAKDKLTEEQKEAVGDRPVYDINIKAGNENITSFNGKTITISLPYTLKPGEDPENIVVYYVKEDGSLEKVNCTYKDGKVIFETDHLSKYVIGYEESDKPVTPDTPDNKKDDNNTIYYAVAAIVVILIIIALAYYFMKKKQ